LIDLVGFNRPTKHIIGNIGDGFSGPNDPTNSVKALKEELIDVIKVLLQIFPDGTLTNFRSVR